MAANIFAQYSGSIGGGGGGGSTTDLLKLDGSRSMTGDLDLAAHAIHAVSSIDATTTTTSTLVFTASATTVYLSASAHPNEINVAGIGTSLPAGTPILFVGANLPAPLAANTTYYSSGGFVGTGLQNNSILVLSSPTGPVVALTSTGSGSVTITSTVVTAGTLYINSDVTLSAHNLSANALSTSAVTQPGGGANVVDLVNLQLQDASGNSKLGWGTASLIDFKRNDISNVLNIHATGIDLLASYGSYWVGGGPAIVFTDTTGDHVIQTADAPSGGAVFTSAGLSLLTGAILATGAGSASGGLDVATGDNSSGTTGGLFIGTGFAGSTSGNIQIQVGGATSGNGGQLHLASGGSSSAMSGAVVISSGPGSLGSGELSLLVGPTASGSGGAATLRAGSSSSGSGGDLNLTAGDSSTAQGDIKLRGHLQTGNIFGTTTAAPTAGAGTGAVASLAHADDTAGVLSLTTTALNASAGVMVTVTFARPYKRVPTVIFAPANLAAAGTPALFDVYVTSSTSGFSLVFSGADQSLSTYVWNYFVVQPAT